MAKSVSIELSATDVSSGVIGKALAAQATRKKLYADNVRYEVDRLRNPSGYKHRRNLPENISLPQLYEQSYTSGVSGITNRAPIVDENGF